MVEEEQVLKLVEEATVKELRQESTNFVFCCYIGDYPYAQLSPNEIEIEVRKGVCLRQPPLCPGKM